MMSVLSAPVFTCEMNRTCEWEWHDTLIGVPTLLICALAHVFKDWQHHEALSYV